MSLFTDIISDIKNTYAPDSRTALFDIKVSLENSVLVLRGCTNLPEAYREFFYKVHTGYPALYFNEVELLPDLPAQQYAGALINVSVANLRTQPKHSAELASQALQGTFVKVWQYEKGWWRIQTPDEYMAWVEEDSVTLLKTADWQRWLQVPKVLVLAESSWALQLPQWGSDRVGDIVRGNIFELIEQNANYWRVAYPSGYQAYILPQEAQSYSHWQQTITKPIATNIITEAFRYKGVPYLWGGTSPKAVDCSGFTKIVFEMNGVMLMRDASQQVMQGREVKVNDLQPADLLFFSDRPDKRITHVAIYIGNWQYIHAAGRVKVNSLDEQAPDFDAFRFNTFIGARRVLS